MLRPSPQFTGYHCKILALLHKYGTLSETTFLIRAIMTTTFTDTFKKRLTEIEGEAKAAGLNFTSICKEAGISRATPDRWKKSVPKTVEILTLMETVLAKHKAAALATQ